MTTAPFDRLKLARRLDSAGFTRDQATGAAEALADSMHGAEIATRPDLERLELRLTIRFGVMLAAAIGVLVTVQQLFPPA